MSKSVDTSTIVAGGIVHYTLLAVNTGQAAYASATLTDSLAALLDDADYRSDAAATSGTVSFASGTVSWIGPLAIGQSVTVTFSVGVHIIDAGDGLLSNRVLSGSVGSTCGPTSVAPCITSTTVETRTITLSDLTQSFTLSGPPSVVASANGAVTMTVQTNSPGGSFVTVQPERATLLGTGTNPESIPVGQLKVRESGTTLFGAVPGSNERPWWYLPVGIAGVLIIVVVLAAVVLRRRRKRRAEADAPTRAPEVAASLIR